MNFLMLYLFIIFIIHIVKTNEYLELEIDSRDLFPYPVNKSFNIVIVPKDRNGLISDHVANTMVILIRDKENSKSFLDKFIYDYGFKDSIDQGHKSEYINVPMWSKEIHKILNSGKMVPVNVVSINIFFLRKSNNHFFELYLLPAQTMTERKEMLSNNKNSILLLKEQIKLLTPPQIELTILSLDGRKNELMLNENATATCRAYDGVPVVEPVFHGLGELDVTSSNFNFDRNERKVQFLVSLFDHEKRLRCTAGSSETSGVIFVMHHPTQVTLYPEPGHFLENGSSVACLKADGYPTPTVRWNFLSGPINSSQYFTISDEGAKFTLSKDAPLKSRWSLNCTSSNVIPGSTVFYHRTVNFTVGRSQGGLFSALDLTKQLILGAVVVGALLIFCCLVCLARKCSVGNSSMNSSRKNGISNKAASKEKGLEAEQVILLPPGSPPNYVDLSNSGAGLPPPPPEYELMLPAEETKRPAQLEKRQDGDGATIKYNEVTYAELNTSNLPMKASAPPHHRSSGSSSSNNNTDDQVIYSQIVGTVSNAYGPQRSYTEPNSV